MSGHSKWANIKHKKEKTDAQRGKIFTKIGKEITVAVKEGGGDPVSNSKLRDLIQKAKDNNVPNDNIERTIKKALGGTGEVYEEIVYEGYGPGGVAVIINATTDNRNRTAGNIRAAFSKYHGNMGQTGCVSYLFTDKGEIIISNEDGDIDEDKLMEAALEAGCRGFCFRRRRVHDLHRAGRPLRNQGRPGKSRIHDCICREDQVALHLDDAGRGRGPQVHGSARRKAGR